MGDTDVVRGITILHGRCRRCVENTDVFPDLVMALGVTRVEYELSVPASTDDEQHGQEMLRQQMTNSIARRRLRQQVTNSMARRRLRQQVTNSMARRRLRQQVTNSMARRRLRQQMTNSMARRRLRHQMTNSMARRRLRQQMTEVWPEGPA